MLRETDRGNPTVHAGHIHVDRTHVGAPTVNVPARKDQLSDDLTGSMERIEACKHEPAPRAH